MWPSYEERQENTKSASKKLEGNTRNQGTKKVSNAEYFMGICDINNCKITIWGESYKLTWIEPQNMKWTEDNFKRTEK